MGTAYYCHYYLRGGHLFIEVAQHPIVAVVNWTSNSQNIGVFRVPYIDDAKPLYIIKGSETSQKLYITAIATPAVIMK
mgnify:CR=1 FL=1